MGIVIFDLDGTLIDSVPDIRAVANSVLADEGLPEISVEQTVSFVGEGTDMFIRRMAESAGVDDPARVQRMKDAFMPRYEGKVDLTQLYPAVWEVLGKLGMAGHRLAMCTNKPSGPTRAVLDHFALAPLFPVQVCGDTLSHRKPDAAPLHAAIERSGGGPAVYVGDSETDAETARNARVPFALYTRGYAKGAARDMPHDAAFDDYAELPAIVDRLMSR